MIAQKSTFDIFWSSSDYWSFQLLYIVLETEVSFQPCLTGCNKKGGSGYSMQLKASPARRIIYFKPNTLLTPLVFATFKHKAIKMVHVLDTSKSLPT